VDATLPFFLPAPTLIGTFGAFIRIRSAIVSKRILFDIGVAGPIAGFAALLVPLFAGVKMSSSHGIPQGDISFGVPLILRFAEWLIFPHVPASEIYLHPVARAAWVGLLATALNLLPIGQLDGGHVLYAFLGERTRLFSRFAVGALAALGLFQLFTSAYKMGYMWMFWAVFLLIFGMRHPTIIDSSPVGRTRVWLALAALAIFILSFTAAPIRAVNP
jgi:membrane-associated protease RseP (regulator of RpoE activity)